MSTQAVNTGLKRWNREARPPGNPGTNRKNRPGDWANSGIGWHTALELARAAGEVILATRSEAKGRETVESIRRELPSAKVRAEILDLASLQSIRAFAAKVSSEARLDLLVNNAGLMAIPKRQVTRDGFEMQFGTDFLGPFVVRLRHE